MTIEELIEILSSYPPETEVRLEVDDDGLIRSTAEFYVEQREDRYKGQEPAGVYISEVIR